MQYPGQEQPRDNPLSILKWGLAATIVALVAVAAVSIGYISRERTEVGRLAASNQTLNSSLSRLQNQIQAMNDKLNERDRVESPIPAISAARSTSVSRRTAPVPDPRIKQLQSRLAEQQKQLDSTREDLGKTRDELQGRLDSTRDELSGTLSDARNELNGSIARTHDELVALQKRGERNYFEFQLTKSKDFRRVGSVSLSLRKANTKRKSYDLAMIIDDNQLQKKGVNLYEPIWINTEDSPQPVQLVVNQISKDQVSGYISEPKYKRSELESRAEATQPTTQKP